MHGLPPVKSIQKPAGASTTVSPLNFDTIHHHNRGNMSREKPVDLRMTVYASLFAALISAGAFIAIPVGPVPIVLQNMFVLMAGALLGWRWGVASILIYLLAGAIGFPVFSGGRGGLAHLFGPTGGYLMSYIPAVIAVGGVGALLVPSEGSLLRRVAANIPGMFLGSAIVYAIGVSWLKSVTGLAWEKAFAVGMLPFLAGDVLKIAAAAYITELIRPRLKR